MEKESDVFTNIRHALSRGNRRKNKPTPVQPAIRAFRDHVLTLTSGRVAYITDEITQRTSAHPQPPLRSGFDIVYPKYQPLEGLFAIRSGNTVIYGIFTAHP